MASAKERAVEAGAECLWETGNGSRLSGCSWKDFPENGVAKLHTRETARLVILAAYKILAEDLVAWHDEQAAEARALAQGPAGEHANFQYEIEWHEDNAMRLRARIQQMAEAL